VTPPPLIKISGKNTIPYSVHIYSPMMVVGPFAASEINLHWNLWALVPLIIYSNAAGMKTSHGL